MKIEIKEIKHGTTEYKQEVALRRKLLRKPLGLDFSQEELANESKDIHLGAFAEQKLLGCLVLSPQSKSKIKMRQVAVDPSLQGSGIGRLLVEAAETKAIKLGFKEMELSARETAVPFYLKLGYKLFGEPFTEVSIPHRKMKKNLGN